MNLDICTVLVASTIHVTLEEAGILTEAGYARGEYGWLIHVAPVGDTPVISEIEHPSPGLDGVIHLAQEKGCRYLLLDRDGNTVEGIKTYTW